MTVATAQTPLAACPLAWLEGFHLTGLSRLPPLWAILGAAALLLLLYVLRLRRRQVEVPFSPLWARLLRDKEPNALWRHLKRLFSLLLQVAMLALLLGAVADPRDKSELRQGRHILVLLDTSASMQARDAPAKKGEEGRGPRSRLEAAREAVLRLIESKERNDYVMLVRMDSQVTPVTSWTRDAAVLQKRLQGLRVTETAADIGRGLRFAADTLREAKDPLLVLVGDGHYDRDQLRCVFWGREPPPNFHCEQEPAKAGARPASRRGHARPRRRAATPRPRRRRRARRRSGRRGHARPRPEPPRRLKAPRPEVVAAERFIDPIAMGKIPAFAIGVGRSSNNVGIVAFNARRNPADRFSHQLFVQVRNYRATRARVRLLVSTGSVLPETVPLEIEPHGVTRYIKKGLPAAGERLTGRLVTLSGSGTLDDFPLDDVAFALLPKREKSRILLVSRGNLYLEGVLLLDQTNISYRRIMPAAWTPSLAKKYDAVIFDDFTPERLPAKGNYLLFDPRGPASPVKIRKRVKDPEIWWPQSDKDKRHPIMDFIRVKDLRAVESSVFEPKRGDVPLIRLDERGDIYALLRKEPSRRIVVVGFSTRQTNWVVRVGFPVFVLNTIAYFAGENTRLIHTYRTGETWTLPLEVPGKAVQVIDPSGRRFSVPIRDGQVSFYGRHIGFYTLVTSQGKRLQIAGNLANPTESDIIPVLPIRLSYGPHEQTLRPPDLKRAVSRTRVAPRQVVLIVVLAALGLLLLGLGLWGGRTAAAWVLLGCLLLGGAVLGIAFALSVRPWAALILAAFVMLLAEWLTYNRRVTV